jgi:hypothetical protein
MGVSREIVRFVTLCNASSPLAKVDVESRIDSAARTVASPPAPRPHGLDGGEEQATMTTRALHDARSLDGPCRGREMSAPSPLTEKDPVVLSRNGPPSDQRSAK